MIENGRPMKSFRAYRSCNEKSLRRWAYHVRPVTGTKPAAGHWGCLPDFQPFAPSGPRAPNRPWPEGGARTYPRRTASRTGWRRTGRDRRTRDNAARAVIPRVWSTAATLNPPKTTAVERRLRDRPLLTIGIKQYRTAYIKTRCAYICVYEYRCAQRAPFRSCNKCPRRVDRRFSNHFSWQNCVQMPFDNRSNKKKTHCYRSKALWITMTNRKKNYPKHLL